MNRVFSYFFSILLALLCLAVRADRGQYFPSDKLSSSLIAALAQDRHGFVWVGTEYGLSRFDGYTYTNFYHIEGDTTSLVDNSVDAFLSDSQGRFWVGTAKGLMRYDYATAKFKLYHLPGDLRARVYTIAENRSGDVLIGTAGYGLYTIAKGDDQVRQLNEYNPNYATPYFTVVFEDSRGSLWQASHLPEFNRFDRKGGKVVRTPFVSPVGGPVAFFERSRDRLLVVCQEGIMAYDYASRQLVASGYNLGPWAGRVTINAATFDAKGNFYLGTSEAGVLVCRKGTTTFESYGESHDNFDGRSAYVRALLVDRSQNVWVGCYKKGLYLMNDRQEAFLTWDLASQGFATGAAVSSITAATAASADAKGDVSLWCTVQNAGVFGFDHYGSVRSHPSSPVGTTIIHRDRQGRYWVATPTALYAYNPQTGQSDERMRFTSAGVPAIVDDTDGRLYVSVYSKGLYRYDPATGDVRIFNMKQTSAKGVLCNDWVRDLAFDSHGQLWIATSNGVSVMNPRTLDFKVYGFELLLREIQSNALCSDGKGGMYIGTDQGLFHYDGRTRKVAPMQGADVLDDKQVEAITIDNVGDLWVATAMGIYQWDHERRRFAAHVSGNGLRKHEYMQRVVARSSGGRVAFATTDGLVVFSPDQVRKGKTALGNAMLTGIVVDGRNRGGLGNSYSLAHDENSFTLAFSTFNYKNADNIGFQYRIDGGRWQQTADGQNAIVFNKLSPGTYKVEVRAASADQVSPQITVIEITVRAPWWASWWAWTIYGLIALAIAAFLLRTWEKRRQADLDDQKMKFLIDATHDIRSPLTLIMGPLKKLKARVTDFDSQTDLDTIDRNAQRLLLLVNQILDERKIDKAQMHLHCQPTGLAQFVGTIMRLYDFHAGERRIDLKLTTLEGKPLLTEGADVLDDDVEVWIDRINFDKVVNNLLSNAMKFTPDGGAVTISVGSVGQEAVMRVTDTGTGFKHQDTNRLFERFYQDTSARELHQPGTGIGLNLCRSLVQMHGGTISAYNRRDNQRGAVFEVRLKLGNSHLQADQIMAPEAEEATEKQVKHRQPSRNITVMVVDDDPEIKRYIASELGEWYRFVGASNGKEALKLLLTEGKVDLVVSDVMMPEMDGIALVKAIKDNPNISDTPVILLTSKSDADYRLQGIKKGADAYIAKPFNMEELHVRIDNLVDNVRRLRGKFTGAQDQAEAVENIEVKGNNDQLMERIMKCVNENIADPDFNVERLTEQVGISRAQLHRKMKEITGISTGAFIRNLRLEQAAKLIKSGKVNVTQVAYSVGFNNQTHFSTLFKKHYGMTPTEYYETKKHE